MKRFARYKHNGELILAAHNLGHVRGQVLDATYGMGAWWLCAEGLTEVTGRIAMDLNRTKVGFATRPAVWADFRRPPFRPHSIPTILYDPRYKLNGTPTPDKGGVDERYGADEGKPWQQIMNEMLDGIEALAELLAPNGRLLAKCQDQVCSGRMRWQTYELTKRAEAAGLELVDRLDYEVSPRPQPPGRTQKHASGNYSTLLIFGRPPIRLRPLAAA